MATMIKLSGRVKGTVEDTYARRNDAEAVRLQEYKAAVFVQSWWRALRVRHYIRHLHGAAVEIQRRWRGFLGRRYFRDYLKQCIFLMKLNFYNAQATKIQTIWRGYYVRKYVFNYYSRKRYLQGLELKNDAIRRELAEYAEQQEQQRRRKEEKEAREKMEHWARKNHHLKSTKVQASIYNSPFYPYPSELEYRLQDARPLTHAKPEVPEEFPFDSTCRSYGQDKPLKLPPLPRRPQGPFRESGDVRKQRYKPLKPTLRVQTDFFGLEKAREDLKKEEWLGRVHDNMLVPFTKTDSPYQALLWTTSRFGKEAHGSKYFREEVDKAVLHKPFKMLVPPIPVFEKFNDTYSMGEV